MIYQPSQSLHVPSLPRKTGIQIYPLLFGMSKTVLLEGSSGRQYLRSSPRSAQTTAPCKQFRDKYLPILYTKDDTDTASQRERRCCAGYLGSVNSTVVLRGEFRRQCEDGNDSSRQAWIPIKFRTVSGADCEYLHQDPFRSSVRWWMCTIEDCRYVGEVYLIFTKDQAQNETLGRANFHVRCVRQSRQLRKRNCDSIGKHPETA
jgi:hypothetical protein